MVKSCGIINNKLKLANSENSVVRGKEAGSVDIEEVVEHIGI